MKKIIDTCFLCEQTGKGKQFTFYSGVMKGGTTHRMINYTVTFFERWSEMTIHEIYVCRDCQLQLWQQKYKMPMILFGAGAAVMLVVALLALVVLWGVVGSAIAGLAAGGTAAVVALVLGALFLINMQRRGKKPKYAEVEPLVVREASHYLPNEKRTFLTNDQYVERFEAGVYG